MVAPEGGGAARGTQTTAPHRGQLTRHKGGLDLVPPLLGRVLA
jgi:hypothetical protein